MQTLNTTELWSENSSRSHYEIIGSLLREALLEEQLRRIDASYLGLAINQWWLERPAGPINEVIRSTLRILILDTLQPNHLECLRTVGTKQSRLAAVFFEKTFSIASKELAGLVHEALSDIAGIVDIKYPYEDHKELSPIQQTDIAVDWGRGMGIIRPHSDDLYEDRAVTIMSLTVCKDTSSTPTWFWRLSDVVACLTDEELGYLALSEATFSSGKNVQGVPICVQKSVIYSDPIEGTGLRLDFRVDEVVGPRMRFEDTDAQDLLDKLRANLKRVRPACSSPVTGSFSILSNHKILHGRAELSSKLLTEGQESRILFRSKGIR